MITVMRLVVGKAMGVDEEAGVVTDCVGVVNRTGMMEDPVGEISVIDEGGAVTDNAELVRASVPVAEESVVESVPSVNENVYEVSGQAELEVDDEVLDDPVKVPVEVPVVVEVPDDREMVWLLVSLACVSLVFESDGDSFEFDFPSLSAV